MFETIALTIVLLLAVLLVLAKAYDRLGKPGARRSRKGDRDDGGDGSHTGGRRHHDNDGDGGGDGGGGDGGGGGD